MLQRLQQLGTGQRVLVFILMMVGSLLLLAAVTVFLILLSLNSGGRQSALPLQTGVTIQQFAVLPDNDAYPSALALAPDGTLYTGSYATGTLWSITPDGTVSEIPNTRDTLNSITGLTVAADGTLYILDRAHPDPRAAGGQLWTLDATGALTQFATITDERGFVAPEDVAIDAAGQVYVTDRGRQEIWRWSADGTNGAVFWSTTEITPTGIAYDASTDSLILTDFMQNAVYQLAVTGGEPVELYKYTGVTENPTINGVAVGADGAIYLSALEKSEIGRLQAGSIVYYATSFRGASDLEVAPDGKLYVTNFDSRALVAPGIQPQLPFALDVVTITTP